MWVKYFVPEDGDDANHPNVYRVDRVNTLGDIKRSFPLSGNFHFRFMKEMDKMTVWMDIIDSSTPLPTYQGGIFIKANRIRGLSSIGSESHTTKSNSSSVGSTPSSFAPPTKTATPVAPVRQPEKLLNMDHHDEDFGGPATSTQSAAASSPVPPAENLFDDNHDLLELSSSSNNNTAMSQKTSSNADLFGLDTLQPVSSPMAPMGGGYYPQGAPRPAGGMNPMMGGANGMNGSMPRPMGASMGSAPRPMGMNQPSGQFNRPGQTGMNGGGYDPFSSLGGMQQRK